MYFFNIIKYKILIHIRLQYGTTAKKIEKYLSTNISSSYIYFLAFLLQIQSSVVLCFLFQSITNNIKIIYGIFGVIAAFFLLNCSTMGRQAAKRISMIQEDNVLLCSSYSEANIFNLSIFEEFFKILINDMFLVIPCIYLLCFFSFGVIDYMVKILLFLFICFTVFTTSIVLLNRKINKDSVGSSISPYLREIWYYIKYIAIVYISYILSKIILSPIIIRKVSSFDDLKYLNVSIKNNMMTYFEKIISFKDYVINLLISFNLKVNVANELLLIIILIVVFNFMLIINKVNYRKSISTFDVGQSVKKKLYNYYFELLLFMNKIFLKDDFFVKKDLQILKQKINLLNYEVSSFIISLAPTINLGILIFLGENFKYNLISRIFLIIFSMIFIFDITTIIKIRIPMVLLVNGEQRNIHLIRGSAYTIKDLIESKIKLLRLFIILPSVISFLPVIYFLFRINSSVYFIVLELVIYIFMFIIIPRLQIYGDIFFDKFNYKSYEEFYENIQERKIYKKFFTIPKAMILFPSIVLLGVNLFLEMPNKMFVDIIVYTFIITSVFYLLSFKILNKGVRNFYEKVLEIE